MYSPIYLYAAEHCTTTITILHKNDLYDFIFTPQNNDDDDNKK